VAPQDAALRALGEVALLPLRDACQPWRQDAAGRVAAADSRDAAKAVGHLAERQRVAVKQEPPGAELTEPRVVRVRRQVLPDEWESRASARLEPGQAQLAAAQLD
jgi:hypothetical protein